MPKISIIIPIFNADQFLNSCIDSIMAQDFKDFELLLIDDGSEDKSGSICDYYSNKYNNIKTYHFKNEGVSSARNHGIELAQGTFLFFVDADDEVPPTSLSLLMKEEADLVIGGYIKKESGKETIYIPKEEKSYNEETKELFLNDILSRTYLIDGPCSKLYKREIIVNNHLTFNKNLSYAEDKLFVYTYMLLANNIITTKDIVYHQIRRKNSLSSNTHSIKHIRQLLVFLPLYIDVVKKYEAMYSCDSTKVMFKEDVVKRYVFIKFNILRYLDPKDAIGMDDYKFLSHLVRMVKDPTTIKDDGIYMTLCCKICKYLNYYCLYFFISLYRKLFSIYTHA